jgi:hypothetical protein
MVNKYLPTLLKQLPPRKLVSDRGKFMLRERNIGNMRPSDFSAEMKHNSFGEYPDVDQTVYPYVVRSET